MCSSRRLIRTLAIAAVSYLIGLATPLDPAHSAPIMSAVGTPVALTVKQHKAGVLIGRSRGCSPSLKVVDLASRSVRELIRPGTPECIMGGFRPRGARVALGTNRITWSWVPEMPGGTVDLFNARTDGTGERQIAQVAHQPGSGGDFVVGPVAAAAASYYAVVHVAPVDPACSSTAEGCQFTPTSGEVFKDDGTTTTQLVGSMPASIAASSDLVVTATADTEPSTDPRPHLGDHMVVEVRAASDGRLLSSFAPMGRIVGLGAGQSFVATMTEATDGSRHIQEWDAKTGLRAHAWRVSRRTADGVLVAGDRIIYRVGGTIVALDREAGLRLPLTQIARPRPMYGFAARRTVWAVATDHTARVVGVRTGRTLGAIRSLPHYNDSYTGWPVARVHSPHGIYSSWLNPGCCLTPAAAMRSGSSAGHDMPFNAGIDIPVNDAHPDPAAPRGTSHPVFAMESGTVWLNLHGHDGCHGSRVRVGHFGYGHTVSRLAIGTHVDAGDVVGWTCLGAWHVHLSEFLEQHESERLNPLRPAGRVGPVVDRAAPTISRLRFYTRTGARLSPADLHGTVDPVAKIQDPYRYRDWPTAPLADHMVYALQVTVRRAGSLVYSRELYRLDASPGHLDRLFYRPLLQRTALVADCATHPTRDCQPHYWLRLWREGWNTNHLPPGGYTIRVSASDEQRNTALRTTRVWIR